MWYNDATHFKSVVYVCIDNCNYNYVKCVIIDYGTFTNQCDDQLQIYLHIECVDRLQKCPP